MFVSAQNVTQQHAEQGIARRGEPMSLRHMLRNPDLGLQVSNWVFTIGSTGLSGYCGWLVADGNSIPVRLASMCLFAMVAVALSNWVVRRERYELSLAEAEEKKDRVGYLQAKKKLRRARFAVGALLLANIATDYSASASLRNLTITKADNVNTVAVNARNEVSRIESKIKDLKGESAWRTKYEAPASYEAKISEQMQITDRGRNVFARTKGCTDTTLAVSQAVCQRIKQLEGDKANAERRQVVLAELKTLGEQLATAKQQVANTPRSGNAALAPIVQLVQMLTQTLNNDKADVQWGLNYFVLFMTFVFSAGIYFCSAELGSRMGPMSSPRPFEDEPAPRRQRQKWLEAPEDMPPHDPIPLKAQDVPTQPSTTVLNVSQSGGPKFDRAALDRLMEDVRDILPADHPAHTTRH